MSRTRARVDDNQPEIVAALRKHGASVACLHQCGGGIPDLLVGFKGVNFLIEVKDGLKRPSARKLTPDQHNWHELWRGQVSIVTNCAEAIALMESQCGITPV
jgi:hypothetical protein